MKKVIVCFFTLCILVYAQYHYSFVTTVDSPDATAFNNSHKIALPNGEIPWPTNTIYIVYHSADSVYYVYSDDGGFTWQTPIALYQGVYPAFDVDHCGFRHIAWQQYDTLSSTYDIYYKCLDDYSPPVNISESPGNSFLPDLVIDSNLVAHIVWVEDVNGYTQIYHRPCAAGIPGDTFCISDYGSAGAIYSYPSISIFKPNNRIYVVWDCFDTASYSPYQIHYRYKETDWSATDFLDAEWRVLRHSSLDFSHGGELLSACWEDSTSDNLEAAFYEGNGGGYPTQGRSMYPVMATVGSTWSYLFWQEDSAGYEDIYYHFYYLYSLGWYDSGSLRSLFSIDEPIQYPNCCGAFLIWTQGESPPYNLYFADFGYPVATGEKKNNNKSTLLNIAPNPFRNKLTIKLQIPNDKLQMNDQDQMTIKIYDISGRLVKNLSLLTAYSLVPTVVWHGTDNSGRKLPNGIYFGVLKTAKEVFVKKIIKTN